MNQIIMWIMAVGAVLGGLDRIAGNRFGLGKRFEEGFNLLGPTALSMAGIICLTPFLSRFLRFASRPRPQSGPPRNRTIQAIII